MSVLSAGVSLRAQLSTFSGLLVGISCHDVLSPSSVPAAASSVHSEQSGFTIRTVLTVACYTLSCTTLTDIDSGSTQCNETVIYSAVFRDGKVCSKWQLLLSSFIFISLVQNTSFRNNAVMLVFWACIQYLPPE